MDSRLNRRGFLEGTALAGAGMTWMATSARGAHTLPEKPAMLGGKPTFTGRVSNWPVFDKREEEGVLKAVRSGQWSRGNGQAVKRFEAALAEAVGAKFCLATSSGTGALLTCLATLGVEAGDEVILPPYTFVACANVILMRNALPVFVDVDPETFQIDANKVEAAITDRTTAIMPVHLGGAAADMDTLPAVAARHRIPIVEDACQAHLGEWRGAKLGTMSQAGCYSFQASKNMTSGEGGAILLQDEALLDKCFAFHWNGTRRNPSKRSNSTYHAACKFMLTEFQAEVLLAQLARLDEQSRHRSENAEYLTSMLREIPGILPARMYEGCSRNAYHLYMLRYKKEQFSGLSRARFLEALSAEGISASSGYRPLNKQPFVSATLQSRGFRRLFPQERLANWEEQNRCPQNDQLCEEAVWLSQRVLLGTRQDMEQIAEAIRKIHRFAGELARA